METIKQNKLLKIAVVILLLANMGTVTTIWLTKPTPIKQKRMLAKKHNCENKKRPQRHYFIEKLGMSDKQAILYKKSKKLHMKKMRLLKDSIRNNKLLIHNELFKQSPDTAIINKYTQQIGTLNAKFEKLTYQHFIDIKSILEPNQIDSFKELIKEVTLKPSKKHRNKQKEKK